MILVADDEQNIRRMIVDVLNKNGYETVAFENGLEVLKNVEKILPDLIILDVSMPELDGFETCKRLMESPKTRNIPIIFLTAMSDTDNIVKGLDHGAVDYITKPFMPPELLARVRKHLDINKSKKVIELAKMKLEKEVKEKEKIASESKQLYTVLEKRNKDLEAKVITDSLTGLYNHKYILDRLSHEVARSKRYSNDLVVFMFDIDLFKEINDTHGHQVGDEVLVKISSLIKEKLRAVDIIGRYGGEEFLVILPNTSLENGFMVAEKIRTSIEGLKWKTKELQVTISGGVCFFKDETVKELVKRADNLLYRAKKSGRNKIEH